MTDRVLYRNTPCRVFLVQWHQFLATDARTSCTWNTQAVRRSPLLCPVQYHQWESLYL